MPVPRSAGAMPNTMPVTAGDDHHEREHAPVERRRLVPARRQQLLAPVADQDAERAAHDGQQQAFGQQLADQPRPRVAPSDRRTDSSFCRVVARESSRFATFAQTISSTSATTTLRIVTERALGRVDVVDAAARPSRRAAAAPPCAFGSRHAPRPADALR